MSRALAAALLAHPDIVAAVGERRALHQLPAGTALPALVYSVISSTPAPYLDDATGTETMRLQVNPLAESVADVQRLHDVVQRALDGRDHQTAAGFRVLAVRRDLCGPESLSSDDAGHPVWTWPRDYIVLFEPA